MLSTLEVAFTLLEKKCYTDIWQETKWIKLSVKAERSGTKESLSSTVCNRFLRVFRRENGRLYMYKKPHGVLFQSSYHFAIFSESLGTAKSKAQIIVVHQRAILNLSKYILTKSSKN